MHWAKLAKFKKDYRIAWWAIALKQARFINLPENKISLTIEFYPPSRRHYDLDNCLASIKSGLDGLADALQVNDRRFLLTVRMVEEVKGYIKVTIQERERDESDN
jgi:crossover junction endodeoxyribonuclease RusA